MLFFSDNEVPRTSEVEGFVDAEDTAQSRDIPELAVAKGVEIAEEVPGTSQEARVIPEVAEVVDDGGSVAQGVIFISVYWQSVVRQIVSLHGIVSLRCHLHIALYSLNFLLPCTR